MPMSEKMKINGDEAAKIAKNKARIQNTKDKEAAMFAEHAKKRAAAVEQQRRIQAMKQQQQQQQQAGSVDTRAQAQQAHLQQQQLAQQALLPFIRQVVPLTPEQIAGYQKSNPTLTQQQIVAAYTDQRAKQLQQLAQQQQQQFRAQQAQAQAQSTPATDVNKEQLLDKLIKVVGKDEWEASRSAITKSKGEGGTLKLNDILQHLKTRIRPPVWEQVKATISTFPGQKRQAEQAPAGAPAAKRPAVVKAEAGGGAVPALARTSSGPLLPGQSIADRYRGPSLAPLPSREPER